MKRIYSNDLMDAIDEMNSITTEYVDALETTAFTDFLKQVANRENPYLSITLPVAGIDPLAALELNHQYSEKFYWDHPDHSISISAAGKMIEIKATGHQRFKQVANKAEQFRKKICAYTALEHTMAGPLFLGGYSFHDYNTGQPWNQFGAARFILPEWMLVRTGKLHLLTLVIDKQNLTASDLYQHIIERVTDFISLAGNLTYSRQKEERRPTILCSLQKKEEYSQWIESVERARKLIDGGAFSKIVIARNLTVQSQKTIKPTLLAHHLRQRFPDCYNFMIQIHENLSFVGATPERLASFERDTILTEGLAGSTSRGQSAIEDAALANTLLQSHKDLEEHDFVVKSIDDSLQPLSLRLDRPKKPQIKKLQNVQHLYTPIRASLKKGIRIHELIEKLHPTPAVGGYPKSDAELHLQSLEHVDRGWYASPVGWFNFSGAGEFAVAIRSALINDKTATIYAGCGIVSESDPHREWEETLLKIKPMMNALNQIDTYS